MYFSLGDFGVCILVWTAVWYGSRFSAVTTWCYKACASSNQNSG